MLLKLSAVVQAAVLIHSIRIPKDIDVLCANVHIKLLNGLKENQPPHVYCMLHSPPAASALVAEDDSADAEAEAEAEAHEPPLVASLRYEHVLEGLGRTCACAMALSSAASASSSGSSRSLPSSTKKTVNYTNYKGGALQVKSSQCNAIQCNAIQHHHLVCHTCALCCAIPLLRDRHCFANPGRHVFSQSPIRCLTLLLEHINFIKNRISLCFCSSIVSQDMTVDDLVGFLR